MKTISLTDKDFKRKKFKIAPAGTYECIITGKTTIKPGRQGGNNLSVHAKITRGPSKGITFFDTIAETVTWKIGQLLAALKKKKPRLTLETLKKLALNQKLRVILREDEYAGRKQNKVVQWLPLKRTSDEEEEADENGEEGEDEETDENEDDEDEDEEGSEDEETADEEELDLENMDRAELKALIEDKGLEIKITKGMSDDSLREKIAEAIGNGDEEESVEEDDDESDEDESEDEGGEEEDEEETPKARSRGKKPVAKKNAARRVKK